MDIWIITIIALVGTILNVKQNRVGFLFWIVSNTALTIHNIHIEEYAQASLFFVYCMLAMYGFFSWTRK